MMTSPPLIWTTRLRVCLILSFAPIAAPLGAAEAPATGPLRFDFESGDLQGWKVVVGKFERVVTGRPNYHNGGAYASRQGKCHLTTLDNANDGPNDAQQGVIDSPVFLLDAPELSFLVGGGSHADTYVALCTIDGKEQVKASGKGGETMCRVQWTLPELLGKPVFLRVVDGNTGGWGHVTLDDVVATGCLDAEASARHFANTKRLLSLPASVGGPRPIQELRLAVEDLIATYGERYPGGKGFLERLDKLESLSELPRDEFENLRREALLANPLVSGQPLLYVVRSQYRPDHHNTETIFQTGEANTASYQPGGPLKTLDLARNGETRVLADPGPEGRLRDPDVHFDGKRIVFSMRKNIRDNYHLYEVNSDGSALKQLTSAEGIFDIDPIYLPDDELVFTSSREPKYCMCNLHIMGNLFRMGGDGANIHQIGKSTLFEGHTSLLPDGRLLYYRWEYVDRNFGNAQGLWTANPDGTNHAGYYGNNTPAGGVVLDPRAIPGTDLVLCILSSCHDRPWGALAILDRRRGVDGKAPILRTWPADAANRVAEPGTPNGGIDAFYNVNPKYEDPYPLSDKYFLCSRMTGEGEMMAIYLIDVFGNEILLHREGAGCYDAMPLAARPRPPVVPTRRDFKNADGYVYVQNVYNGTHMKDVKPGSVKYLRVVESPEKRFWTVPSWKGQGDERPGMNWHDFNNKRILGTVPVEADGSASFAMPSDRFVYFQLLDANGMMVQSMRSGTTVQSGEWVGCVGCHDERRAAPPTLTGTNPLALKRPPSRLDGWHGPAREFNYLTDVQPVFDKHCVSCHDYGKEAGKKLVLAGDRGLIFNASYVDLWTKGALSVAGAGPPEILQAYSWGSHPSKLTRFREGTNKHTDVKLTAEEMERIVTWVDLNAPYYPSYASAYPNNLYGRSPLDDGQLAKLKQLGVDTGIIDISFDRPEMSPGLAKLPKDDARYPEALAIIRAGQDTLRKHPNPDSSGFVACEVDQQRERKYQLRAEIELRNRAAIRDGRKVYDTPPSSTQP